MFSMGDRPTGMPTDAAKAGLMTRVIGGAMLMGLLLFTAIASFLATSPSAAPAVPQPGGPGNAPPTVAPGGGSGGGFMGLQPGDEMLFFAAAGLAALLVPASFVVRRWLVTQAVSQGGDAAVSGGMTAAIVGFALCEGPGLFGAVLIFLTGAIVPAVFVAAAGSLGLALHILVPVVPADRDPNTTAYNVGR